MKVCIEADGGSRGNPGTAGCGTVVYDGDHETVLARIAEYLGRHTNNVAEYHGLINGLVAAQALGAREVDVFLDSKLVVEQMTGRWKIKHADMKTLAGRAKKIAAGFDRITYRWIARSKNSAADELANKAMDAARELGHRPAVLVLDEKTAGPEFDTVYRALVNGGSPSGAPAARTGGKASEKTAHTPAKAPVPEEDPGTEDDLIGLFDIPGRAGTGGGQTAAAGAAAKKKKPAAQKTTGAKKTTGAEKDAAQKKAAAKDTGSPGGAEFQPTRLVLLRHGETAMSVAKTYSGGSSDPQLTDTGIHQARCAAGSLLAAAGTTGPLGGVDAIVTSPLKRCTATAEIIGRALALPVEVIDGLTELDFGDWDGLSFTQARDHDPLLHARFLTDTSVECPNGESVDRAYDRVEKTTDRLLADYPGQTVLVVTHVTPIKSVVRRVLGAKGSANTAIHLDLSSMTIVEFYPDGPMSLRLLNSTAHLC